MFYQYQHFGVSEHFCKEYGKDFSFPKHVHRSFEFITVLSGSMTVQIDNKKVHLQRGESVLIFPNQVHSLKSLECEHLLVIFSQDMVMAYYAKHTNEVPICNKFKISPTLATEISNLCEQDTVFRKKGIMYLVCDAFDKEAEYEKHFSDEQELLCRIFEYVDKNYAGACSLHGLHNALGYSEAHLSRYFSKATGMSFVSFVNRYKISKACYLLKNTNQNILACAMGCGYTSLRSFNRNFLLHVGMTPSAYRA